MRTLMMLSISLFLLLPLLGFRWPWDQREEKAYEQAQAGQHTQAEQMYENLLKEEPDQDRYVFNVALMNYFKEDYEASIKTLGAVNNFSLLAKAALLEGNAQYRQGDLLKAQKAYRKALGFDPELLLAKYNLEVIEKLQKQEALSQDKSPESEEYCNQNQKQDSQSESAGEESEQEALSEDKSPESKEYCNQDQKQESQSESGGEESEQKALSQDKSPESEEYRNQDQKQESQSESGGEESEQEALSQDKSPESEEYRNQDQKQESQSKFAAEESEQEDSQNQASLDSEGAQSGSGGQKSESSEEESQNSEDSQGGSASQDGQPEENLSSESESAKSDSGSEEGDPAQKPAGNQEGQGSQTSSEGQGYGALDQQDLSEREAIAFLNQLVEDSQLQQKVHLKQQGKQQRGMKRTKDW